MEHHNRNMAKLVLLTILGIFAAVWAGGFNFILGRHIAEGRCDQEIRQRVLAGGVDDAVASRALHCSRARNEWIVERYGVEMRQFPTDLVTYEKLLFKLRPDVVIETGTFAGGLTLHLASILRDVRPEARIVTIDIDSTRWDETRATLDLRNDVKQELLGRIQFIQGSSTSPEVLEQVQRQIPPGGKVLVILDSLHTKEHVLAELKLYAPLVTPGSYIIVNDTDLDGIIDQGLAHVKLPGYGTPIGVRAAVEEFLASCGEFDVDAEADRFLISCNHSGILRRVKSAVSQDQ
jgi:cephalosporin hydroxylase